MIALYLVPDPRQPASVRPPLPTIEIQPPRPVPAMRTAAVYVRGRRVAWSRSTCWSPRSPAFGEDYTKARRAGLAGRTRRPVGSVVRDLLSEADGVLVQAEGVSRVVHVTRPAKGGSIRAAWSETTLWSPYESANHPEYKAARAEGAAGVETGLEGLRRALAPLTRRRAEP